ncbi:hypothetical protein [Frankia sp. AvcI1]|uniref:hypothetical protein n=1 Tax=Frankia sp. AvcI1 TaxID=573496 RepID=UPI0006EC025C|nr:hypothetical protein [Frankia sp. AvcI1]
MTATPTVRDILSYLAAAGWSRQPGAWRGASIWAHDGQHEVLVPGRDGMGDAEPRFRELLAVLASVEGRPRDAVAADIATPMTDLQWYRLPARDGDAALGLLTGLTLLSGARDLLGAAARAALAGPHIAFAGPFPREVRALLTQVLLAPFPAAEEALTVRVPLGRPSNSAEADSPGVVPLAEPFGRRVLTLAQDALLSARDAASTARSTADLAVFDATVTAGVSANLCVALAQVADAAESRPFEIGFRWGRGVAAPDAARAVAFPPDLRGVLKRAANHLRGLRLTGSAAVTGVIGALFDDGRDDRFRVQVRGEVVMGRGSDSQRSLWVRLAEGPAYDLAIAAHRDGSRVRMCIRDSCGCGWPKAPRTTWP